jgi:hypothetical protein
MRLSRRSLAAAMVCSRQQYLARGSLPGGIGSSHHWHRRMVLASTSAARSRSNISPITLHGFPRGGRDIVHGYRRGEPAAPASSRQSAGSRRSPGPGVIGTLDLIELLRTEADRAGGRGRTRTCKAPLGVRTVDPARTVCYPRGAPRPRSGGPGGPASSRRSRPSRRRSAGRGRRSGSLDVPGLLVRLEMAGMG